MAGAAAQVTWEPPGCRLRLKRELGPTAAGWAQNEATARWWCGWGVSGAHGRERAVLSSGGGQTNGGCSSGRSVARTLLRSARSSCRLLPAAVCKRRGAIAEVAITGVSGRSTAQRGFGGLTPAFLTFCRLPPGAPPPAARLRAFLIWRTSRSNLKSVKSRGENSNLKPIKGDRGSPERC